MQFECLWISSQVIVFFCNAAGLSVNEREQALRLTREIASIVPYNN